MKYKKTFITKFTTALLCTLLLLTGCNTQEIQSDASKNPSPKQTIATKETELPKESANNNKADSSGSITSSPKTSSSPKEKQKTTTKKTSGNNFQKTSEKLSVHFIDVGQGDAILIKQGSHAMLIDAGDNDKGTTVQLYLKKQGIQSLDYIIGTHPDADHIGGLDVIIYKYACKKILLPDCSSDTATYRDVISSIKSKNYTVTHPTVNQKFSLGKAAFTITGPVKKSEDTNNNSLSLRLTFEKTSFLFTGDTTQDTEPELVAKNKTLKADVLKIAHHGSKYSTTPAFLSAVSPKYAVISCATNNRYGFPSARVLNLLRQNHIKTFRTDEQGSMIATSNGHDISWNTSPSTTWKSGENTQNSSSRTSTKNSKKTATKNSTTTNSDKTASYIINENTKKFHLPSCYSVQKMAPKNSKETKESRQKLINQGYSPCKNCNP